MSRIKLILLFFFVSLSISHGQITPKKLLKEHKKAIKPYKASNDMTGLTALLITGDIVSGDVVGDVRFLLSERKTKLEFDLLGATFYSIYNDSINWSYNPFDKSYEFEPVDNDSDESGFGNTGENKLTDFLNNGYSPKEAKTVKLDSIEVYELRIASDKEEKSFFFDQDTYYMVGHKWEGEEEYYFNYQIFEGRLWPKNYVNVTDGGLRFNFNEYTLLETLDPSLFEMSEEVQEAYGRYLDEKNNPPKVTPSSSSAQELYDQGVQLSGEGNFEEAIEVFSKALKLAENDPIILNMRGLTKSKLKDYYGAIADYERAIEANPDYATAINNRGLAKYNLNDFDGAIKDYSRAIELDASNHVFYSNKALALFQQQDYTQADVYFSKSIELDSAQSGTYYLRGISRAQIEKYSAAAADYKKAIDSGITHQYVYNYYGVSLSYLGEYEPSLEMFQKAHELNPTHKQYLANIGEIQRSLERYEASLLTFDKLIALDTTDATGYADKAISEYDLKRYEQSLKDINKAISLYAENALYYDYRAFNREALNDLTGAIEDFTKSLLMEPDSNIYYHRGLVKTKMKDDSGACEDFKKSADMDDNNGKEAMIKYCDL